MIDLDKTLRCSDGTKIKYRAIHGRKKEWIVFLHGYRVNSTVWTDYLRHFEKKGYSTLTFDLRGHGLSGKPKRISKYRLSRYSKDLQEVLRKEGIRRFVLVGYSMGGTIALDFSSKNPFCVRKLILISTCSHLRKGLRRKVIVLFPLAMTALDILRASYTKLFKSEDKKEVDYSKMKKKDSMEILFEAAKDHTCRLNFSELASLIAFNAKKASEKITSSSLIIGGDEDELFSVDSFKKLQNSISNSELKIFKGNHCMLFLSPEKIINSIEKFISD